MMKNVLTFATILVMSSLGLDGYAAAQQQGSLSEEEIFLNRGITSVIQQHIDAHSKANQGEYPVYDPVRKDMRKASFIKLHEEVQKAGDNRFVCADFKDTETGKTLDVDIEVKEISPDMLQIVDAFLHKIDGKPQFHYDEKGQRVPEEGLAGQ